jgi:hypothetical protein
MKKNALTTIVLAVGLSFSVGAMADSMSKQDYKSNMVRIESEYKSAKNACNSLSGNANDICEAEAYGNKKVAKANLDARNKNSRKASFDARIVKADADYFLAKEKCDDLAGNTRDICVKEAKATETSVKADAKVQLKTSNANSNANEKSYNARKDAKEQSSVARHDANVDKRDAVHSVALEKCDDLAGAAKDNCVSKANRQYGMK